MSEKASNVQYEKDRHMPVLGSVTICIYIYTYLYKYIYIHIYSILRCNSRYVFDADVGVPPPLPRLLSLLVPRCFRQHRQIFCRLPQSAKVGRRVGGLG